MASPLTPALVFDLDGTLVDTAADLRDAANAAFHDLGGHDARTMLGDAVQHAGGSADATQLPHLLDGFIAFYGAHIADKSRPYPGVDSTLAQLKAEGARLAVLTSKPHGLTMQLLSALRLDTYFGTVCGTGRISFAKPDARVFHHVVQELGGPGAGAMMVGDSVTDVQTARAAGVPVILVTYGYAPEPAHTLGADAVTDDFREVPALVHALMGWGNVKTVSKSSLSVRRMGRRPIRR